MKKIFLTTLFLAGFWLFSSQAEAATIYIDFTNGSDANAGTASSTARMTLDNYFETTRAAGDIGIVRRGMSTTTGISDLLPLTSVTTRGNPVAICADFHNVWGDFANSAQTYEVTTASTTMTASATISDISAGQWVYVVGDHTETPLTPNCKNAYAMEVLTVTGATLTLANPYQGFNTGSGQTLRIMPYNPIWNTTAGDFQYIASGDDNWYVRGLHFRGTDANGVLQVGSTSDFNYYADMVLECNGASDTGFNVTSGNVFLNNSRIYNCDTGISGFLFTNFGEVRNIYVDCNNVASSEVIFSTSTNSISYGQGITSVNCTNPINNNASVVSIALEDFNYSGSGSIQSLNSNLVERRFYYQDYNNTQGNNQQLTTRMSSGSNPPIITSTSSVIRTGGASESLYIYPNDTPATAFGTTTPHGYLDITPWIPFYTSAASTTIEIYFKSASTTTWSNGDPTNEQLYIEVEYYGNANNTHKVRKQSTGVLDFNGTTTWQSLSMQFKPARAGVGKWRVLYGKNWQGVELNNFYMDIKPIFTQP